MGSSTDVFGALTWGMRKFAWVVMLPVLAIGVLVPLAASQATPVYEAEATVAPNKQVAAPSVDVLPRFGESVFSTDDGVVAESVREAFGMPSTTVVIPRQVELVTEQDNVAMTVIGRSDNPEDAAELANVAAATFQLQLNQASDAVAYYIVIEKADPPASPEPQLAAGTTSLVIGILGGLIVGLALVVLLVVLRRPVLDPATAQEATGAPVLGRVTLPPGNGGAGDGDAPGVGPLCRRLLAEPAPGILIVSPKGSSDLASRLTTIMVAHMRHHRRVLVRGGGTRHLEAQSASTADRGRVGDKPGIDEPSEPLSDLVLVDGPTIDERLTRPDTALVLLVVPEGIGLNALHSAAEEYLDGGPAGVVLVRKRGMRLFRRRRPDSSPATIGGADQHDESPDARLSLMVDDRGASDAPIDFDGDRTPVGEPTRRF